MVARSAYAQLGYSPLMLAGTLLGLFLVYIAPVAIGAVRLGACPRSQAGPPGSSWR